MGFSGENMSDVPRPLRQVLLRGWCARLKSEFELLSLVGVRGLESRSRELITGLLGRPGGRFGSGKCFDAWRRQGITRTCDAEDFLENAISCSRALGVN